MVFGPQNIRVLNHIGSPVIPSVATEDNPDIAQEALPAARQDGVKAWVTIMYGCDNFCSYCIVPYTRGREKSRPVSHILEEVSHLAGKGYREITLLGQNVNSYTSDTDFPGLLRKLDTISGIERIRFVTSHPRDLSDELIAAMAELKSVCEHIHLPLQSGSDRVLQLMNRGYSYDAYINKISRLRERIPEIAITTDIIAGFPGESAEDHACTLRALREIEFDGIFAFKFSQRPGTKAAEIMEQVPDGIKSQRLDDILDVQDEITSRKNTSLEGTVHEILIEGCGDTDIKQYIGRTRTNKIVTVSDTTLQAGLLLRVEIIRGRRHSLEGKVLLP
jgi:tRNA-2-methylthio-N6-dimethylallyladenosine synthase